MSDLTILNTSVRQLDNLYSLNDLHRVSGSEDKHAPFRFMRNEQTQELISEIQKDFGTPDLVFQIKRGKNIQGTYACEELALAYATWISPKFHLVVLRAFIAIHKGEVAQRQLALPTPEPTITIELTQKELKKLINVWMLFTRFEESMGALLNKVRPFVHGNIYSLPEFNQRHSRIALQETFPLIKKLMGYLPKKQSRHSEPCLPYNDF